MPATTRHLTHQPDADGICTRCGFDSHEWRWWRYNTAEGMTRKTPPPVCDSAGNRANERRRLIDAEVRRVRWMLRRELPRALRRMRSAGVKGEKSE